MKRGCQMVEVGGWKMLETLRDISRKFFSFYTRMISLRKWKYLQVLIAYICGKAPSRSTLWILASIQHKKALKEKMNSVLNITAFLILCTFVSPSLSCDPVHMIKDNEGHMACMYLDIKLIKTIGCGYNMMNADAPKDFKQIGADFKRFFNGPLTPSTAKCNCSAVPCLKENQIDTLLEISVKTAIADAKSLIKSFSTLCCPVQNVMVDMAYTLGGPGFRAFTPFSKLVDRQYWKMAGDDLTCSKWCNAKHQDTKRCLRDAAIVSKGCGCSGSYPQVCTPTASSCCGSQETCCKGQGFYLLFNPKICFLRFS